MDSASHPPTYSDRSPTLFKTRTHWYARRCAQLWSRSAGRHPLSYEPCIVLVYWGCFLEVQGLSLGQTFYNVHQNHVGELFLSQALCCCGPHMSSTNHSDLFVHFSPPLQA